MQKNWIIILLSLLCLNAMAQDDDRKTVTSEELAMGPTFVPTVKVGKVLHEGDSIQYMEMNNIYVYPSLNFKDKKQAKSYMRLVTNVKKVLPIAKEARQMLIVSRQKNNLNILNVISYCTYICLFIFFI